MAYKYYTTASPLVSASITLRDDMQALVLEQFSVATDYYTILEEYSFASGSYVSTNVRITSAIDPLTQEKLGDDWKRILFSDFDHPLSAGKKFYFNDNYWIVINVEYIKSLTPSCTVRRCNNVLRWKNTSGSVVEEPCCIDYSYKNPKDNIPTSAFVTPGAYIRIYSQLNNKTREIKDGQRFIFGNTGNWNGLKVFGGGVENFQNTKTIDNDSAQLLALEVGSSYVNEDTDNIILGIADYYEYSTSASSVNNIVVTPNSGSILEGNTQIFDVRLYSGSVITSSSFVFSVSGSSVPSANYLFTTIDGNSFSIQNVSQYLDYPLSIICSSTSGSRQFDISLMGAW